MRVCSELTESGEQWIGRIPVHWVVCRLGYRYEVSLGKMLDAKQITGEQLAPYLRNVDVQWDAINTEDLPLMDFAPDEQDRYRLRFGDLLVCEGGEVGRAAVWHDQLPECYYQKALHRLRAKSLRSDKARFLFYLLRAATDLGLFTGSEGRSTIAHLTAETLRGYRFPFPPLPEQRAIASFLDRETAKIDALVGEQRRLVALLKEKRQAVISRAITKGLDPTAKMKPSGIEWLGDIPAHWEVIPLKRLSPAITVGIVVNPSEYVAEEGLPFIYGGNMAPFSIDHVNARRISPEDSERNAKTRLREGDILTVRVGEPGVTAVVPAACDGGNCASVMLTRKGEWSSQWLAYAMNSRVVRYQVEMVQYGAAQEQFNISHAVDFLVPTPPIDEAEELADCLDGETSQLLQLEAEAERAIALLQERRSALISAAVTGKIDLRDEITEPTEAA